MSNAMPSVRRATPPSPSLALKPDPELAALRDDVCEDSIWSWLRTLASDVRREKDALSGAISAGIMGSAGAISARC